MTTVPEAPKQSPDAGPERIQRRRTKGWRMPEGAVYVGRPSRWGNPYRVGDYVLVGADSPTGGRLQEVTDRAMAARLYRDVFLWSVRRSQDLVPELAGKDLVCWCPLDQPCHADVLLEIANGSYAYSGTEPADVR